MYVHLKYINKSNMKYSDIIKFLHSCITIMLLISLFILDYKYLPYAILIPILIFLGWLFNSECVLLEYEKFIECTYEKNEKKCNSCNKLDRYFSFYIKEKYHYKIAILIIYVMFLLLRIIYKDNLITFESSFYKRFLITLFTIFLNVLFLILIVPSIQYNEKYKNKKQFIIYIIFYIIIIVMSYYYYFVQNHI